MGAVVAGCIVNAESRAASAPGRPDPPRRGEPAPLQLQLPFWGPDWRNRYRYATILLADFDGDGQAELLGRNYAGMEAHHYDPDWKQFRPEYFDRAQSGWFTMPPGPPWGDDAAASAPLRAHQRVGFSHPRYFTSIRAADVDGDGRAELLVRWHDGIHLYKWVLNPDTGRYQWNRLVAGSPAWPDMLGDYPDFEYREWWSSETYYESIWTADLDGDGAAELIGRTPSGLEFYKFVNGAWQALPNRDTHGQRILGGTSWNLPQYVRTVRFGDIDGDRKEEMVFQSPVGLVTWKLIGDAWHLLEPDRPSRRARQLSPTDDPEHYETIRLGDLDGDGKAELFLRTAAGAIALHWNSTVRAWQFGIIALLDLSDANGFDKPQYYRSLRLADIDGDGRQEILIRNREGVLAYKWDPQQGGWVTGPATPAGRKHWVAGPAWPDVDPADPNNHLWDQAGYYETIRTGDVDGDRRAELIAVGPASVEVWKLDLNALKWYRPTTPLPTFTGNRLAAYQYLSRQLTANESPTPDLRSRYGTALVTRIQAWQLALPGLAAPPNVPADDWTATRAQILQELVLLAPYVEQFRAAHTWMEGLGSLKFQRATEVYNLLQADELQRLINEIKVIVDMLNQEHDAILGLTGNILARFGAAMSSGGFAAAGTIMSVISGTIAAAQAAMALAHSGAGGVPPPRPVTLNFSQVAGAAQTQTQQLLLGMDQVKRLVVQDLGLLKVMSSLAEWDDTFADSVRTSMADAFELWCWQVLSPQIWKYCSTCCLQRPPGYPENGYTQGVVFSTDFCDGTGVATPHIPQLSSLQRIFNAQPTPPNPSALGQCLTDVYYAQAGWGLYGDDGSTGNLGWVNWITNSPWNARWYDVFSSPTVVRDPANRTVVGGVRELPQAVLRGLTGGASPAPLPQLPQPILRREPGYSVDAQAGGASWGDAGLIVPVLLANQSVTDVDNVVIEAATLAFPNGAAACRSALPTRQVTLARGERVLETLTFAARPQGPTGVRLAALTLRGSYLAGDRRLTFTARQWVPLPAARPSER